MRSVLGKRFVLVLALTLAFAAAASSAASPGRSQATRSGTDGEIAFIKSFGHRCPHQAAWCSDSQIFTIKPDGTDLRQITQGSRKTGTFSLAPDGRSVLYTVPEKRKVKPASCGRRPGQTSCGRRYSGRNAILEDHTTASRTIEQAPTQPSCHRPRGKNWPSTSHCLPTVASPPPRHGH